MSCERNIRAFLSKSGVGTDGSSSGCLIQRDSKLAEGQGMGVCVECMHVHAFKSTPTRGRLFEVQGGKSKNETQTCSHVWKQRFDMALDLDLLNLEGVSHP